VKGTVSIETSKVSGAKTLAPGQLCQIGGADLDSTAVYVEEGWHWCGSH